MSPRSWIQRTIAWLPLLVLPSAAIVLTPASWERWVAMWLIAGAIFVGVKWLTWLDALPVQATVGRHLGYLFAWPGLDARVFLQASSEVARPKPLSWCFAFGKLLLGVLLLWGVVPALPCSPDWLRGWVGMIGIVFVLHFGSFHLLSLAWRTIGVNARSVMDWPVLACSVSDFWGRHWNTAFRDLTHRYLFRPMTSRLGGRGAVLIGFFFSGIIHELVTSVPAGAGFGRPTAFFLIQAAAVFVERSAVGRRVGLGRGVPGWAFTMLALLGPVTLLFHLPFVQRVVVPFVNFLTGTSQAQG